MTLQRKFHNKTLKITWKYFDEIVKKTPQYFKGNKKLFLWDCTETPQHFEDNLTISAVVAHNMMSVTHQVQDYHLHHK
jgi:hypothetical protein